MAFQPFNPDADVRTFRNHLPHWRQSGVTYFVTTRLADSIPHETLLQWKEERDLWLQVYDCAAGDLERLPESVRREYHRRFTKKFHEYLDAGSGQCGLRTSEAASIVAGALRHFDGDRYTLGDFVVMPNHLHVLVTPIAPYELSSILHSWKRFSAQQVNKLLHQTGPSWQDERFNHIVRSEEQLDRFQQYIKDNPRKAHLRDGEYLLSSPSSATPT